RTYNPSYYQITENMSRCRLGRLGELSKEDPYFVLAALIAREEIAIRRCIKDTRKTLPKKYKARSELKFKQSDYRGKRRILQCIANTDNDIVYVLLRKDRRALLAPYLRAEPQVLYTDLYRHLLQEVIAGYEVKGELEVVIDRFLYGYARKQFDDSLSDGLRQSLNIFHMDSRQCPCLQAVDFIAGAIARRYRDDDDIYYNKIKHKIIIASEFQ
ncbi:MAG TPA: DUF3800 domain-containing protein, partial [Methanotrichaceae archaeon]|nr:DUF3800 domain-containing protein [Methanotrichaceae archaeon]HQF17084.1 DUF3800 domain-containing protein [Methanotrichaceae archaeon]HQI91705.1 DUF3800 domain-containing protein [Methanotrichaceae archaeon]HQJ29474.1 DUF3800 domain-containing protein [Methanotrichaceae archaeon]